MKTINIYLTNIKHGIKKTFLVLTCLFFTTISFTQLPFSYTYTNWGTAPSLYHFSIETSNSIANPFYIYSSTEFTTTSNNIHLKRIKADGAYATGGVGSVTWKKRLSLSNDDRVLDVLIDQNDDIVITGYSDLSGTHQLYIAKFDASGNFLYNFLLGKAGTVGTKIIESSSGGYYISGYETGADGSYNMQGKGILIHVDQNLSSLSWKSDYTIGGYNSVVNDILELPNGNLFITGSVGSFDMQYILACVVDPTMGGNMVPGGDLTFASLSDKHSLGVSSVYDIGSDILYLLANTFDNETDATFPILLEIKDVTKANPYYGYCSKLEFPVDDISSFSGFKLLQHPASPHELLIYGYRDTSESTFNTIGPWSVVIDKTVGVPSSKIISWDVDPGLPSIMAPNYKYFGGPTLSMFSDMNYGGPYIYTPDMATVSPFLNRITSVSPNYFRFFKIMPTIFSSTPDVINVVSNCANRTREGNTFVGVSRQFTRYGSEILSFSVPTPTVTNTIYSKFPFCTVSRSSSSTTSITENKEKSFKVFPNPFKNKISFNSMGDSKIKSYSILNGLGKIVLSKKIDGFSFKETVDVSNFSKGIYLLKIIDEKDAIFTSKIIKQ